MLNFIRSWEYPNRQGVGCNTISPSDSANFLSFLQELRADPLGEKLTISTHVQEWRAKVFLQKHVVTRGDDLICESVETRIFCVRDPVDRRRIHGIPVPEDIRRLCE